MKPRNVNLSYTRFYVTTLLLLFAMCIVNGQDKWNMTMKGGISFPTQTLAQTKLNPGFGYEGVLSFQFHELLSVYGGWAHHFFGTDELFAEKNLDFEETGYSTGLVFTYPAGIRDIKYKLGLGIIYDHIEAEDPEGDIIADSGHQLGAQIEATMAISLSNTLHLVPFARYRVLETDITIEQITTPITLSYVSFGAGVMWTF